MAVSLGAQSKSIDFPSKTLPPALHRKYATESDFQGQLETAVDGVRGLLLSKGARKGEETMPDLARQKRLRVTNKPSLVVERGSLAERQLEARSTASDAIKQQPVVPFKDVAAESFILPLVNRFWAYYQDSSTREVRARARGDRYRGAGTGMILSPSAVEKFLMTLVLLLHAARHSSLYLNVLAPESLELALTLGGRSHTLHDPMTGDDEERGKGESAVVGAALELSLVVLDASYELDGGRTLANQKASLLTAAGEWASRVFQNEEKGVDRLSGQAGMREGRVRSGAAGVVVKVSEIAEKWGRLGIM
jgi:telomere length regulation protein